MVVVGGGGGREVSRGWGGGVGGLGFNDSTGCG